MLSLLLLVPSFIFFLSMSVKKIPEKEKKKYRYKKPDSAAYIFFSYIL